MQNFYLDHSTHAFQTMSHLLSESFDPGEKHSRQVRLSDLLCQLAALVRYCLHDHPYAMKGVVIHTVCVCVCVSVVMKGVIIHTVCVSVEMKGVIIHTVCVSVVQMSDFRQWRRPFLRELKYTA